MRISLAASGLLDPQRLNSWLPERRRAIRAAVENAMKTVGKDIVAAGRKQMQSVFNVRSAGFTRSLRHRLYTAKTDQLPALKIGSPIPWLGIHVRGGTVSGRLLIPLLPEHQRIGRKAFARVVDSLIRSGNGFFIRKNGKVILMAENIAENSRQLTRFKRAERQRTGQRAIKRGQEIPIAVLVPRVRLKARFNLPAVVQAHMPALATAIVQRLAAARV